MPVPLLACMVATATYYNLPPRVLPSIHRVEGGSIGMASRNTDGSEDLGLMQINTRWIQPLAEATGLPAPVVRLRLLQDGCFNIAAAGAILRTYLNEARGDLMTAIGYYHSHTPTRHFAYRQRVLQAATDLFVKTGKPRD
ncbi:Lytic transglycosylase domain-containing protein [Rhodovastum atsumiense]|uniref:Lytic transglycosylase domain-containing protein n=1 Tax=Rhodovastum atsumiense TaxID=504468 RepID=A0A5M6IPL1_9PROT|nr:lytic transglycosylase domain-containing protein [Rhodovastum atsumiense]KAA5609405.1 lytic transglycosylase domain-containing protein [Rhodovastum atsumiense]CAH2601838.1 Lytic transglycosylase domain-containing protein [Rhodovastum atsumiense]